MLMRADFKLKLFTLHIHDQEEMVKVKFCKEMHEMLQFANMLGQSAAF